MNLDELESMCAKQEAMGLDALVLKMPAPKSWTKPGFYSWPEHVRTPFGLCRYTGGWDGESVVIWPSIKQVRKFIKKARNQPVWRVVVINETPEGKILICAMTEKEAAKQGATVVGESRFSSKQEAEAAMRWAYQQTMDQK